MNRAQILDAARQAVLTDRNRSYGEPAGSFALVADLWSTLLGADVSPAQAALMLGVLKVARAWDNPGHADSFVDLAGYAACAGELAEDEGEGDLAPRLTEEARRVAEAALMKRQMEAVWPLVEVNLTGATGTMIQVPRPDAGEAAGEPGEGASGATAAASDPVDQTPSEPEAGADPAAQAGLAPDAPAATPEDFNGPRHPKAEQSKGDGKWRGPWSTEEDAFALDRKRAGVSAASIADLLQRPVPAVSVRIYKILGQPKTQGGAAHDAPVAEAPGAGDEAAANASAPEPTAISPAEAAPGADQPKPISLPEHLERLPADGWMPTDDIDLLAFMSMGNIAITDMEARFGRKIAAIRARRDALTLSGTFPVTEVLTQLELTHGF